jgi:DNA-binding response OmpR family regulator
MMDFPEKVLFIDDDEEEQFIVTVALNECCQGIKLIYEKDANSALSRMENDNGSIPDMIILNWRMSQISGKEVLIRIRKHTPYAQIPIVIFTGILDLIDLDEAKALGATFFLGKPLNFAELCQKLAYLFTLNWRDTKSPGQLI